MLFCVSRDTLVSPTLHSAMSTNYPRLSVGMPDISVSGRAGSRRPKQRSALASDSSTVSVTTSLPPQSHGDRLLADAHLSKCAFLHVVHRFIQEYAAYTRRHGSDLFIKVYNYRMPAAPRSVFDTPARASLLQPSMEWCPLYLTHQTDLADVRVHLVMRPHASEAIVTLPHVVRAPTEVVSRDQSAAASSVLQVGGMEFALCDPLTLGVNIVCSGAAVDRSMRPSHLHELPSRAAVAHRAGKSAGLFYHALAQEPLHEWRSPDDVCMPTEYLSKTSEGVHVVLYNAGRGEREHSLTHQLMPTVALALRDVHLSMDDLFSLSEPPRWPMTLAFMQLCKLNNSPAMLERAKAVLEAYRTARSVQQEMEDTFLCSEYVSDDTYGAPAYRQMQEYYPTIAAREFDALEDAPERTQMGGGSEVVQQHHHARHAHHSRSRRDAYDSKPQCAIC